MEFIVLALFAGGLLTCIIGDIPILFALLFGYVLFFGYGLYCHFSGWELGRISLQGIKTVRTILTAFVFIGMITASWRACGTIPEIIYSSSIVMVPAAFLLITFLLNAFVSVLTGTSFGTVATIGVICMTIGNVMGIDPAYLGGATLSGIYVGDRCSPMSTSALLVSGLTKTDLFQNIRLMVWTGLVPLIVTGAIYLSLGFTQSSAQPDLSLMSLFSQHFNLHWLTWAPALLIILLSAFRINVIKTMGISTCVAAVLCYALQEMSISDIAYTLIMGFHASDPVLAKMMDGGGIQSMLKVGAIVCISASYFGIFDKTGLLDNLKHHMVGLAYKITPYGSAVCASVMTGMIACNQSLAIMLAYQLCQPTVKSRQQLAIILENTAVVISPLIPWNIAGAVPIETLGVPMSALLFAFYLYVLPLWNVLVRRKR